jgi:hypothetical protein
MQMEEGRPPEPPGFIDFFPPRVIPMPHSVVK